MKILFISNYYPPYEVGGYEQLCRDVAARLTARGHITAVLTSDWGVASASHPDEPGIYRLLRLQLDFTSRVSPILQFFVFRQQVEVHNRRRLRAVAAQFMPDVIFMWNLEGLPRTIAIEAESVLNNAVAYWLAGYSPAEPDEYWHYWSQPPAKRSAAAPVKALLGAWAKRIMRSEGLPVRPQMRHVAVVSEYLLHKGQAEGILPPHARVIYNGVELEQFVKPVHTDLDGPLRLLQAGRVSDDKGVHTAVEAVGRLVRNYGIDGVHLDIAGSGPAEYEARLQQLIKEYNLEAWVSLLGWRPRERMPELMSQCDVLLLPTTHQEPFARVVLEAMASGLVVVATPTGGTLELLQDESSGLVFSPGDSDHLARQIKRLLTEPRLRQTLAAQGQRLVLERFSLTHMVDEVERLLGEACRTAS